MNQPRVSEKRVCAIHRVNLGASEAPECDWPHCGCDPEATRVLDMALECGWIGPREATDARARLAAAEAQVAALREALRAIEFAGECRACPVCGVLEDLSGNFSRPHAEGCVIGAVLADTAQAAREWEERVRTAVVAEFGPVFSEITLERYRQEEKHGPKSIIHLPPMVALACLAEEVGEAAKAIIEQDDPGYRTECLHVATVAVAMIQAHDRALGAGPAEGA